MSKTISLKLTEDELEILSDALEADMEGYVEAAKDLDLRAKDYWAAHFADLMRRWGVQ